MAEITCCGQNWPIFLKMHLLGTVSVIEPLQKTHRSKKKDNKFVLYREK